MRLKYPSFDDAVDDVAKQLLEQHTAHDLARMAALMLLRLTCYWSRNPITGEILIRGTMLSDPELEM
jgi:hypothetical protein